MQQYYGLNLDGMGSEYSHAHAACCAAQLPAGARVWRGTCAEWQTSDYLLWSMEYHLRIMAWQRTEDGAKGINKPRPIESPAQHEQLERQYAESMANRAFVDSVLGNHREPQGGD